jgi:hypothetical protein
MKNIKKFNIKSKITPLTHPTLTLTELRERLDCRQIAQAYGLHFVQRRSEWWTARCPNSTAHTRGDKNPSFSIGAHGYKCFSTNCAISGGSFELIGLLEQLDPKAELPAILEIALQLANLPADTLERAPRWRRATPSAYRSTRRPDLQTLERPDAQTSRRLDIQTLRRSDAQAPLSAHTIKHLENIQKHIKMPSIEQERRFSLPADHPRLKLMSELWDIVADAPLGPQSLEWLSSRGLNPEVAWAHGCRDWTTRRAALQELFRSHSAEELIQAGLARRTDPEGDPSKLTYWAGLRSILHDETWAQGVAIPIVHPGWHVAPLAWRWRLTRRVEINGRILKVMAPYGGEPNMPTMPLGMAPCDAHVLEGIARWPNLANDPSQPRYAVIVSEGEPDWLSVAEVSAKLETDLYIVSLGLVSMSSDFPPEAAALLDSAQVVVCMMDKGRAPSTSSVEWTGGVKMVERIRGWMLHEARRQRVPFEEAWRSVSARLRVALQDDDHDLNALHQRGQLEPLITKIMHDLL